MIANSTNISNRMFRSQRYIILMILSFFFVLLVITGVSGHHEKVVEHMKNMKTKASDSLAEFYNSGNLFSSDKSQYQMEKEAEEEEELEAEKKLEAEALEESEKAGSVAAPDAESKGTTKGAKPDVNEDTVPADPVK